MATTAYDTCNLLVEDDLLRRVQTLLFIVALLAILAKAPSMRITTPINVRGMLIAA